MQRKHIILSNFKSLDEILHLNTHIDHEYIGTDDSIKSSFKIAWRSIFHGSHLILNIDHKRLFTICAIFSLIAPRRFRRCQLVSVDILLRPPLSIYAMVKANFIKLLLSQVNTFILYFKNWEGYIQIYGISRDRMVYVPFKVNSWEYLLGRRTKISAGEYVLCAGETLRDHFTFIEAIRITNIPALLVLPGKMESVVEQFPWYQKGLPNSLKLEFHTDGKESTYLGFFENARIVCLPRYRWDIASTGISAYLCAMALGKCVVISRGPGAEDLLDETKSAAFFEPENPIDLGNILLKLWNNPGECQQIAENGTHYAAQLKGEKRLMNDILKVTGVLMFDHAETNNILES